MSGEDEVGRLLRELNERRKGMAERIIHGGVSADNVPGGYRECVGYVKALDDAEEMIRDIFRGWLPMVAAPAKPKSNLPDY